MKASPARTAAAGRRKVPPEEWWRTEGGFFLLTEAHRANEGAKAANFIERTLALHPGARVLDVGCGWGRVAIELARRKFSVVGVDASKVISLGRLLAAQAKVSVDWVRGDMRAWSSEPVFDAAVLWGMSFGYFDEAGNQEVLRRIGASLRPGGRLLMDLHNRDWYLRNYLGEHVELVQGKISHDEASWSEASGRLNILSTVADGLGKVLARQWHSFREYTPSEVKSRLETAGLEVGPIYSGMGRRPGPILATHSSWQIVATRPASSGPRSTPTRGRASSRGPSREELAKAP